MNAIMVATPRFPSVPYVGGSAFCLGVPDPILERGDVESHFAQGAEIGVIDPVMGRFPVMGHGASKFQRLCFHGMPTPVVT